jgi:hypothetical protein
MSDSDWGKRFKARMAEFLLFLVILASLCWGVYWCVTWGWGEELEYSKSASYQTEQYSRNTYRPEYNRCAALPPQLQGNCINKAQNEKRAFERDEHDLVAQKKSALWAYIMGAAALGGLGLSALGVYLVWTTFNATREANKIAKTASTNESQSYVHIKSVRWAEVDDKLHFMFFVQNSGQTPCKRFEVAAYLTLYRDGKEIAPSNEESVAIIQGWNALPGNQVLTCAIRPTFLVSADTILRRLPEDRLVIRGVVDYKTFYNNWFRSEFSFFGVGRGKVMDHQKNGPRMSRTPHNIAVFEPIVRDD